MRIKYKAQNSASSLRVSKVKDNSKSSYISKTISCHEKLRCAPLHDKLTIPPSAIKQNDFKCILSLMFILEHTLNQKESYVKWYFLNAVILNVIYIN